MAEQTTQTTPVAPVVPVEKPSRLRTFRTNHPRITKAVAITGAFLGTVAVTRAVTNAQANKDKLAEARDHATASLDALSDSVATPTTEA